MSRNRNFALAMIVVYFACVFMGAVFAAVVLTVRWLLNGVKEISNGYFYESCAD